jgi:hypothetical protein
MEAADIPEGESRWFCPSCEVHQVRAYFPSVADPLYIVPFFGCHQKPPSMPPSSLLSPLIHYVQSSPPVEFQLPEDIRTFFKFGELLESDIRGYPTV